MLTIYILRKTKLIMIEDDFFIIFVDSILLDRICFTIYIVTKKPTDYILVYTELLSLRFKRVGNEHCYNEVFVRSIISVKYFLQCLYQIQTE